MPEFSRESVDNLNECHPELQDLFHEVIRYFDCTIVTGHRGEKDQDRMFDMDRSQLQYPESKHNKRPALAVDAAPYPIDWNDRDRFHYFAGFVKGVAARMGISVRWGGDWDDDTEVKDNNFDDLIHFEISDGNG